MYRENDWVYVIAEDSRLEGFIPHSYCTPYNSHLGELALNNFKKKLPRDQNSNEVEVDVNVDNHQSNTDFFNVSLIYRPQIRCFTVLFILAGGDVSDNESCSKKEGTQNQQPHVSVNSSQASLHSASSSQPDIHPFFKVCFYLFVLCVPCFCLMASGITQSVYF